MQRSTAVAGGRRLAWWVPRHSASALPLLPSSSSASVGLLISSRRSTPSLPSSLPLLRTSSSSASSSSSSSASSTSSSEMTRYVPGNPPTPEEMARTGWVGRDPAEVEELAYAAAFPGHVRVSEEVARRAPLRRVAASLFSGMERDGRLPRGREERVWARWEAALARLQSERGVTTLHDLAALPRVAWWRTKLPSAFRSALNTFLYHQRLPAYAVPRASPADAPSSSASASASSASSSPSASA